MLLYSTCYVVLVEEYEKKIQIFTDEQLEKRLSCGNSLMILGTTGFGDYTLRPSDLEKDRATGYKGSQFLNDHIEGYLTRTTPTEP